MVPLSQHPHHIEHAEGRPSRVALRRFSVGHLFPIAPMNRSAYESTLRSVAMEITLTLVNSIGIIGNLFIFVAE